MFKKIENVTRRLVMLRLNSGRWLFMDPRTTSGEIPQVELVNNTMFKKLSDRGIITEHPVAKQRPSKRPKKESPAPAAVKKEPGSTKETKKTKKTKKSKKQIKSKGGE
jgi:hypothetical protein